MRFPTILGVTALSLVCALRADALCSQTGASQADQDLWNKHGCWSDFYLWQAQAYALREKDWVNRGWDDACDINLEYPKHWNASYLITFGLPDNPGQFHGTEDYRAIAEAAASKFHDATYATIRDGTRFFGSYNNGAVTTYCPLYNVATFEATPGSRAGDFMHEGWHAWMDKYGYDNGDYHGHHEGPLGLCTVRSCDYFFPHNLGDYEFGEMHGNGGENNRFHSPIQAQVEYLCDIVEHSKPWVTTSVRLAAEADGNARAADSFINAPGPACAIPTPLLSSPPPIP